MNKRHCLTLHAVALMSEIILQIEEREKKQSKNVFLNIYVGV